MDINIIDLIHNKQFARATEILDNINNIDIASLIESIVIEDAIRIFRLLKKDDAAEVFSYLSSEVQLNIIEMISDSELTNILDDLFLDDTVDILETMPANIVKKILKLAKPEKRDAINKLLTYKPYSAGAIMTPEFLDLRLGMSIQQSLDRIRTIGNYKETVNSCYILDSTKHLVGVLSIKELLLSSPEIIVDDIMTTNLIYTTTNVDQEKVSLLIKKYDLLSIPVVDDDKRMVGIITIDDIIDVIDEETTEDIQKMAAITPTDTPYLQTSVWKIWLHRVPWLLLLMISATFTGIIIKNNEETLNLPIIGIILTGAIPMLMDTGGNAGSQASVTIIRSLALGEIKLKDIIKVLWKEFRVSLLLGITLMCACFIKLILIDNLHSIPNGYTTAIVICISMFFTVMLAKLIGCTLPIIAKAIKLDPAVVASPFITTIIDAISLTIYCQLAISILGNIQ